MSEEKEKLQRRADKLVWSAARRGASRAELVELVHGEGSGVEYRRRSHGLFAPLHIAAYHGHAATCAALVGLGASPMRRDKVGAVPLHYAAEQGHGEACAGLLRARGGLAALAAVTGQGWTPLHWASRHARKGKYIVRALVAAGADVEARDGAGLGPLHWACFEGSVGACRELLRAGADPLAEAEDGATPAEWARSAGKAEAAAFVEDAAAAARSRASRSGSGGSSDSGDGE